MRRTHTHEKGLSALDRTAPSLLRFLLFEIGIDLAPFGHRRQDTERDHFVAQFTEMLVARLEFTMLFGRALHGLPLLRQPLSSGAGYSLSSGAVQ